MKLIVKMKVCAPTKQDGIGKCVSVFPSLGLDKLADR